MERKQKHRRKANSISEDKSICFSMQEGKRIFRLSVLYSSEIETQFSNADAEERERVCNGSIVDVKCVN